MHCDPAKDDQSGRDEKTSEQGPEQPEGLGQNAKLKGGKSYISQGEEALAPVLQVLLNGCVKPKRECVDKGGEPTQKDELDVVALLL